LLNQNLKIWAHPYFTFNISLNLWNCNFDWSVNKVKFYLNLRN
jgi:hypothetical protein